ncbi:PDC sensor domain-containing protein, partial [Leptospira sp. SA-E8]|uniref:PDC sensor domain-containing protein n=1 Tax=Leptospira sp. SA-E8 TaxID=3422259 RepID=UPI003EBA3B46
MPTRQQIRAPFFWLALGYAGLVLVLAWQLKRGHDLALAGAGDHAENLVQILDGQLNSTLQRIETNLHQIANRVPRAALKREARWQYQVPMIELLQSYQENFPELANFFVWDRQGRVLYSTTPLD